VSTCTIFGGKNIYNLGQSGEIVAGTVDPTRSTIAFLLVGIGIGIGIGIILIVTLVVIVLIGWRRIVVDSSTGSTVHRHRYMNKFIFTKYL